MRRVDGVSSMDRVNISVLSAACFAVVTRLVFVCTRIALAPTCLEEQLHISIDATINESARLTNVGYGFEGANDGLEVAQTCVVAVTRLSVTVKL